MTSPIAGRSVCNLSKEISPALVALFFAIFFSLFLNNSPLIQGWEVITRALFLFFRLTLLLCLPLYVLSPIYSFVVDKIRGKILQTEKIQELHINPIKHWGLRPFQGISIGLLFETKLLTALQVVTGVTAKPFPLFPQGQFQPGRLLVISGITVVISLLLSILWTLDDVGIRYANQKDQEIRMIGKYVGTLMPLIFGFYGIFSLIADFPTLQAFIYLFKTVIILYPPFTVFTVLHTRLLKNKAEYFFQKASLKKGGVWFGGENDEKKGPWADDGPWPRNGSPRNMTVRRTKRG
jgi:hypothetical protein